MNFYKLILKSITNNYKNYLLYIIATTISVMFFFSFSSIQYNEGIQTLKGLDGFKKATDMSVLFKNASIQVALFIGAFVVYCNSFFMDKRKKEIGLYSILGAKKSDVIGMLFLENIVMLIVSLIAGIFLGLLGSKLFTNILISILGIDINVNLKLNYMAIMSTIKVFTIISLISILLNGVIVYRYKLIDLLKSSSKPQKAPKASIITTILSILFLYNAHREISKMFTYPTEKKFVITSNIFMLIGIYLLIISILVYIIKLGTKNKRNYYKNINMTVYSNILFKIKKNAIMLALLSVLTGVTLLNASTAAINYFDVVNKIEKVVPFSFVYNNNGKYNEVAYNEKRIETIDSKEMDKKIEEAINKYSNHKIINSINAEFLSYQIPQREGPMNYFIISNSKYKDIIKLNNEKEKIENLSENEAIIFNSDYYKYTENSGALRINFKNNLKIKEYRNYDFINSNAFPRPNRKIVVSDDMYKKLYKENKIYSVKAINVENDKNSKELTAELLKIVPKVRMSENLTFRVNIGCNLSSYYEYYNNNMIGAGSRIFLNSLLAVIFLVCIGSIIFFKQMSEANENKELYENLNKIGVSKKEIRNSIIKQTAFVFYIPLVIGIIYTKPYYTLLDLTVENVYIPKIIVLTIFILLYMLFYILTLIKYYRVVTNYK